jgi:hypothetical protein
MQNFCSKWIKCMALGRKSFQKFRIALSRTKCQVLRSPIAEPRVAASEPIGKSKLSKFR